LKLEYHELLPTIAFNFNLRRYNLDDEDEDEDLDEDEDDDEVDVKRKLVARVGRCRLTVS